MTSVAKKKVAVVILIAAIGLFLLFLFAKEGSRGTKIIHEGDRAPEFRLQALDGSTVSLADFRGKVVMVHFWATWCPPCVEEMPMLEQLYRSLGSTDFKILAVSVDEGGAGAVAEFMQRNGLSLPALLDPGKSVAGLYGTFKFPETYILDRRGVVKYKAIGPRNWTAPANMSAIRELIEAR
ncbi:MAG TPA: TlpA disulfide reductase family protein [Nitrospirota bacterium]|nr:TlpA disulfide reductase family protein [Nitrospirota bacterium]